jgi:hypothetical protein
MKGRMVMARKAQKIKRGWVKFLENLKAGMTQGEAYLACGYRCKSPESAARSGSRLLIKLREIMHGTEMFDIYVPDDELSRVGAELLHSRDERVRTAMFGHAAKVKKWLDREDEDPKGITVVIAVDNTSGQVDGYEPIKVQAPAKPRQIID